MILAGRTLPAETEIGSLASAVERQGGRLLVVGGWVRDALLGRENHDVDLEVFGLAEADVSEIVRPRGFTPPVGKHFSVWRHTGKGIDLAMPRGGPSSDLSARNSGALTQAFADSARHRDLTVNAIGWDPVRDAILDPLGGTEDLQRRQLRAADPKTFGEDPLRVLRVARLHAHLPAEVTPSLEDACRSLSTEDVPRERRAQELRRILLELESPAQALSWLDSVGQLSMFPPLARLRGIVQSPKWHPEGDVWIHTRSVLDCAATLGRPLPLQDRETLLWAALCHDLGKPQTTTVDPEGLIRSIGHERASADETRDWLSLLGITERMIRRIEVLVAEHLTPAQFVAGGAKPKAYRRLARRLAKGGVSMRDLERLARADHLGRTTEDALSGNFPAGPAFLTAARKASVAEGPLPDLVSAADLMREGVPAGPEIGRLLALARDWQDRRGETDAARLLQQLLRHGGGDAPS